MKSGAPLLGAARKGVSAGKALPVAAHNVLAVHVAISIAAAGAAADADADIDIPSSGAVPAIGIDANGRVPFGSVAAPITAADIHTDIGVALLSATRTLLT